MDIFLCSTVRHLLFSLLKASSSPERKCNIIMIVDQQNIDVNSYNVNVLPVNVNVVFLKRSELNAALLKIKGGRVVKLLANVNIRTFPKIRTYFKRLLFTRLIPIVKKVEEIEFAELYLFNDRNKLSRLLRLGFDKYSIIEDGTGNYKGIKFKPLEMIINRIKCNGQKNRYFGDDRRCQGIFLLSPDKAPQYLQHKVSQITFINEHLLTQYCIPFFKAEKTPKNINNILATQPINAFAKDNLDFEVYKRIIHTFKLDENEIFVKVHPREDINLYKKKYPQTPFIESKIPLELLIFYNPQCNIISLCSSAGLGFEKYCNRVTLIDDDEHEALEKILATWRRDYVYLDNEIRNRLSSLLTL